MTAPSQAPARILVIDDSPQNLTLVATQLSREGYEVLQASSGRLGIETALAEMPTAILLDIMMPGMDGFEVCRTLRSNERTKAIPIVVLTSLQERADKLRALQAGADDFLSKPVDRAELLARVASVVRIRQLYEELADSRDEIAHQARLLAAEKSRVEALLYSMSDGVVATDLDGKITLVNPAAELLFGTTLEAIAGRPWVDALAIRGPDGQSFDDAAQAVASALAGVSASTTAAIGWRADGTEVALSLLISPVRVAGSDAVGLVIVCRDVTAQREVERLKSELIGMAAHELRTPLGNVFGFSELLLNHETLSETGQEFATHIHHETQRLLSMVSDFLDLDRLQSGRLTYYPRTVDLADVVDEVRALLRAQLGDRQLLFSAEPQSLRVRTDRERLVQVLVNLTSNALKYSDGGDVTIATRAAQDVATVAVRDQGFGLTPEAMSRLFTRFYRVDSPQHRKVGGTGLGLTICKQIVEDQGGRIWAESPGWGQGSTFLFTLPVAEPELLPPGSPKFATGGYVLVVKDDPAFATLVRTQLGTAGYDVESVPTGEEALERAHQRRPAAVVLDVGLAGKLDGFSVLLALRKDPTCADVPVVMIPGRREGARGLALGVDEFLLKPVPAQQLVAAVRRAAGWPAPRPILVADDDAIARQSVVTALIDGGFTALEARDGDETLEQLAKNDVAGLILDLTLPKRDGFDVLEAIRADPFSRNLPVMILTGRQLSVAERQLLTTKVEGLLLKSEHGGSEVLTALRGVLPNMPPPRSA